jgi:DNA uptake protein ComE-like DNA-binding protein
MMLYTRKQVVLVLLLVGAAGAGLAIDHWRRARPAVVERLEALDRAAPAAAAPAGADRHHAADARSGRRDTGRRPETEPTSRRHRHRESATGRAPRDARLPPDAPLDVNRASVAELTRLPGIGRVLAARIVAARPFGALDDLARVRGLRGATLDRVRPLLTASP